MARADEAMYASKRSGKNRATLFSGNLQEMTLENSHQEVGVPGA